MKICEIGEITVKIQSGMIATATLEHQLYGPKTVSICTGQNAANVERDKVRSTRIERKRFVYAADFIQNSVFECTTEITRFAQSYYSKGVRALKPVSRFWRVAEIDSEQFVAIEYSSLAQAMAAALLSQGAEERAKETHCVFPLFNKYQVASGRLEIPFPQIVKAFVVTKEDSEIYRVPMKIADGHVAVDHLKANDVVEFVQRRSKHCGYRSKRYGCRVLEINRFGITLQVFSSTNTALKIAGNARPALPAGRGKHSVPLWKRWDFETVPLWDELRNEGLVAGWYGAGADQ